MNRQMLALLSAAHFIVDSYPGAFVALLPAIVLAFRLSYTEAALLTTALNLVSALTQPLFGLIVDRGDRLWLVPAGCLVAALGLSLFGLAPSYAVLLLLVVVGGFGVSVFHPASSRAANRLAGTKKATGMTLYATGGNFGYAMGPLLAAPLLAFGGLAGSVYLLAPGIVFALWLWRSLPAMRGPQAGPDAPRQADLAEIRREAVPVLRMLSVMALRMVSHWGLLTFFPLYLVATRGAAQHDVSRLLFLFLFFGAVGTPLGGLMADRWGVRPVIVATLLAQPPLIYLLLHSDGVLMDAVFSLNGFLVLLTLPLMVVLAQDVLPSNVGFAQGLVQGFGFGLGGVVLAGLGAYADFAGIEATLGLVTLISLPAAVIALGLPGLRRRLPVRAVVGSEDG